MTQKGAFGEQISDERKKLGQIGETISEGVHRHAYDGEQISDGPDTWRDSEGNIISESLHLGKEVVKKSAEVLPGAGLVKETVRGGGTLLRNFSARIRRKR